MPAWSGLWDGVHGQPHALIGSSNIGKRLQRALRPATARKYREILRTFVTDDVGSTALATHTRIADHTPGNAMTVGGVRGVVTVTDINRAVTAADETALLEDIDSAIRPTYPVEKSGNSGGGKLGF